MLRSLSLLVALCLVACQSAPTATSKSDSEMEKIKIQFIRNATLKMEYAGKTILVDPMLSPKNSFMSFVVPNENLNPTIDLKMPISEVLEDVNLVLLTHPHLDHFDQVAKDAINKELPFFTQPSDLEMVQNSGFKKAKAISDSVKIEDITIYRTGGKHAVDLKMAEALGPVSGFVLQAKGFPTVYLVGDCVYDEEVKAQIAKFKPDVIVTNSGGAMLSGKRILMDENETIALAKSSNAQVIATHIEALDHCKVTRTSLEKEAIGTGVKIQIPIDGEYLEM